ncbi:hypothetical protein GCM10020000_86700 [Streptomyces olivoverticillatus]
MDNMATEFREPVGPIMLGLIATGAFTAVGNRIYRFIVRIFSEDGSFAATPAGRIIRWLLVSIPFSSGFAAVCLFAAPPLTEEGNIVSAISLAAGGWPTPSALCPPPPFP